jgi:hypothetical protein
MGSNWNAYFCRIKQSLFLFFACAFFLIFCTALYAKPKGIPAEYQVKAALLYHFVTFVEWPSEALTDSNDFFICIIGQDPFGRVLDQAIFGKVVRRKKLSVLRIKKEEEIKPCHILFISTSERDRLKNIRERVKGTHILTVGDMEQSSQIDFVINFVSDQNKVRFEINPSAAERAGLKISAQLLKFGIIIEE